MKRLALSLDQFPNRFDNKYFLPHEIDTLSHSYPTDFYSGIFSPHPCPSQYDKKTIKNLALSGDLIIDIDGHTPDQRKTWIDSTKKAIQTLEQFRAPFFLAHSGRGCHFHIKSALKHPRLARIHRMFVSQFFPYADTCIYHPAGLIRHLNTRNSKSDSLKIPIDLSELDIDPSQFQYPRKIPELDGNPHFDQLLLDLFEERINDLRSKVKSQLKTRFNSSYEFPIGDNPHLSYRCRNTLKSGYVELGNRHQMTLKIAYELKQCSYDQEEVLAELLRWAIKIDENQCSSSEIDEILDDTEEIVRYVYQDEYFTEHFDFKSQLKQKYHKLYQNRKNSSCWKGKKGILKVYCVMLAASQINPRFFMARNIIVEIAGAVKSGKVNYIQWLLDHKFIERIPSCKVKYYAYRRDHFKETYCYEIIK